MTEEWIKNMNRTLNVIYDVILECKNLSDRSECRKACDISDYCLDSVEEEE